MLTQETVDARRADQTTGLITGVEHLNIEARPDELVCGGKPADARANDSNAHGHARAESSRTAVTMARTCSGLVSGRTP